MWGLAIGRGVKGEEPCIRTCIRNHKKWVPMRNTALSSGDGSLARIAKIEVASGFVGSNVSHQNFCDKTLNSRLAFGQRALTD